MEKIVIEGKSRLKGEVTISGAKNAAVAILPATILVNGICTIDNIPQISDIKMCCKILETLGAKIRKISENTLEIDSRNINNVEARVDLTSRFRASYYLTGALLGRCHHAIVGMPGGCNLGARPMDQHVKAFETLGATVESEQGIIEVKAKKLQGNSIYLDTVSVGATINAMLAAVLADGVSIIENAAKEPHIVDLANFLNKMGAKIQGAGTDRIRIQGVPELKKDGTYSVVPDQIEAGTFMLAAVATRGDITIKNCITKHLEVLSAKIVEMGAKVEEIDGDTIRVSMNKKPNKINIKTAPYPGFPTDLQPQMGVAMALADGTSVITESIWDSRFQYAEELNKMGAKITAQGKVAFFEGVEKLVGAPVYATDLRAGAALIVAGVAAEGTTVVYNIEHIDRGYENIEEKFRALGAKIERVVEEE